MKKFKLFLNFDKEEAWLNDMAAHGQLVNNVSLAYRFAPIKPGSAVVRVDWHNGMSQADYADYLALYADSGWRLQSGRRSGGPQYFASFGDDPDADIFSDQRSKAARYRKSIARYGSMLLVFLVLFGINLFISIIARTNSVDPAPWWVWLGPFFPWLICGAWLIFVIAYKWRSYRRTLAAPSEPAVRGASNR